MAQGTRSDGAIKGILVAVLVMGILITAGEGIIDIFHLESPSSDFIDAEKYTTFNESFNRRQQVITQTEELRTLLKSDEGFDLRDLINIGYRLATTAGMSFLTSFGYLLDMFDGLSTSFGVPVWVPISLFTLLLISIAFSIISLFFQREL